MGESISLRRAQKWAIALTVTGLVASALVVTQFGPDGRHAQQSTDITADAAGAAGGGSEANGSGTAQDPAVTTENVSL
ncbi:hypothetical protein, partial [Dactylosporangium siamense]|uniref:hypothetical protein n=2 Tax=Dactylosporangium siamense TaxID=685454 RepID=UPI0031ECEAE8